MRTGLAALAIAAAAMAAACRGKPSRPLVGGAPSASAAAEQNEASSVAPDGAPASAALARCGWGAVNADPGILAPPWAIALLDVEVRRSIASLRLLTLELSNGGDTVARMEGEPSIRVQEGASTFSFGAASTHELEGTLSPGSWRLRVASRLGGALKAIAQHKPTRCELVLSDENGEHLVLKGALDPVWQME